MTDSYAMQKRYFEVQIEQMEATPLLNQAKIEDCRHYIKLLEESGSADNFMKAVKQTGNMISTAKADSIDRYENSSFVYEKLGELKKLEENEKRLEIIRSSTTHTELSSRLEEFETATKLAFNENKAFTALASVMSAVFQLGSDGHGTGSEKRSLANFKQYWKLLKEADPDFSWEKISTYPPYRDRIIYTDRQMEILEKIFRRICNG